MCVSGLLLLCSLIWLALPGPAGAADPQPVDGTGVEALIDPLAGGTVSLAGGAAAAIPAGALEGTTAMSIAIHEVSEPPSPPPGFVLLDSVYEFTVDGRTGYTFAKPVTLTFTYRWESLPTSQTPSVQYYDEAGARWVSLGGTVSPGEVETAVDHCGRYGVFALRGMDGAPGSKAPDVPSPEDALNDIAGHWAESSIKEMITLGAISGYPDSSFKPDAAVTRAEFAAFLVKAMIKGLGYSLEPEKSFDDMYGHWAGLYISSALSYGVVGGYDDRTFGPNDPVTREQMAAMLVRAVKLTPAAEETPFADSGAISAWAGDAVAAAVKSGIMTGYPDNTFRPQGGATRAEAVTAILNALKSMR
jgi:hypothetical protein